MDTANLRIWDSFKYKFFNEKGYTTRRKIYNTLWAVLFGFIISGIIIVFTGNNPFLVFASLFEQGATTFGNKLISVFIAYLFASLAVAICFKAGLFNIGISGQMMGAGFTTLLIFRSELLTQSEIGAGSIVLAFFVAMFIGMLIALIAGFLKSTFGINEVVSTIMLNWVIFFLIKFFIQDLATWNINGQAKEFLASGDSLASNLSIGYIMPSFFYPQNVGHSWYANYWNWVIISLGIFVVVFIWFILSKTSFGYKIKMIGLNKDASEYSGTNQKSLTLIVMAMSGALSGIAGFIWYTGQGGQIDVAEQPLLAGFDAIAISLLVFNDPISISISSLMYGMLSIGSNGLSSEFSGMQKEINQVIIGAFVYCAAITVVFSKLNVFTWIKRFFILCRYEEHKVATVNYWKARVRYYISWFSTQKELIELKNNNKPNNIANKRFKKKKEQLEKKYIHKDWIKFDINKLNEKEKEEYLDKIKQFKLEKEKDWEEANKLYWKQIKLTYKENVHKLELEYAQKYNLSQFKINNLSENDQIEYFEKLVELKRLQDNDLSKAKYFDKNPIKSKRIVEFQEIKKEYYALKKELLKEYEEKKELKKIIKLGGE
ncbi:ABC transporter permease [Mesomycoplasma moatsii]|uniref:ABC transporter permease n=1 Tax=Mesomycoplasma moatsii TaxID=171287 RepID=UPI0003B4F8BD